MSVVPKFIEDPTTVVDIAVDGLCELNNRVKKIENTNVVVATEVDPTKVLLLCGGGSGHEPAHAGFVAKGWLSAAICGSVFASPPTAHVSAGIEYLAKQQGPNGPGILVIIKNYAGDILNFQYAVRQARAQGIQVETVLSADDAVFGTAEVKKRRGVAGCCLLYKALGAAAQRGQSLAQLKSLADRISNNMRSIGASLSSCALPGSPPSSVLPHGVVEVGLGIHGEKGLLQVPFTGAAALTKMLVAVLLGRVDDAVPGHRRATTPIPAGVKALLLVNNLGGTADLEMNTVTHYALHELVGAGVTVVGVHSGRHMTSLDMHGFSITLLVIADEADLEFVLNTNAVQKPFMNFHAPQLSHKTVPGPLTALQLAKQEAEAAGRAPIDPASSPLCAAVKRVFDKLVTMEAYFNGLDAEVGDGDLGSGVHRSSMAVLEMLPYLPWEANVLRSFTLISKAVADACAGTSGPLYGALLIGGGTGAAKVLAEEKAGASFVVDAVRAAIAQGSQAVQELGGARKGDRTMVDALEGMREAPAVAAAQTVPELIAACHLAARAAADATAQMPAKFGRSLYLQGKEIGKKDPGAELVVSWLEALQ
ncbi:dihydroxyacetone kinase 1-like protein [Leptomonas pyrrhocoris]|uniref:Dihydroxyacetone kinase 1-like protein n=1 Tax=Leptomonas pyrrhocoris TaxID=157538 RepID=A0A0N0DSD8_LEPPY|nr:dihydroxyacetone kinase 1-like protein [Leptomonas pyrrhocoris]KPA75942.1 dihydroxyacetone kinase 1-like protein [Leptomonas pyrrhocoris]|eukprot:XP_015654381.1 dihydroxyacetone kinase 1-like protein [Leptomonas pyrrhocoris]